MCIQKVEIAFPEIAGFICLTEAHDIKSGGASAEMPSGHGGTLGQAGEWELSLEYHLFSWADSNSADH